MNDIQKRYGNKAFKVIAVNLVQEPDKAKSFLEKIPANFIVACYPGGLSATAFKVKGMPSSFLIDRTGKLHLHILVFVKKKFQQWYEKLLREYQESFVKVISILLILTALMSGVVYEEFSPGNEII